MDLLKKIKKVFGLIAYLRRSKNVITYFGFVGFKNLGDEALFCAVKKAFDPIKLINVPYFQRDFFNSVFLKRKHPLLILGGGTLIGENSISGLNRFRTDYNRYSNSATHTIAFGTGVGQIFDNVIHNKWLWEWKGLLDRCDYVGVRGPRSVHALSHIGIAADCLGDPACLLVKQNYWKPKKMDMGVNIGGLDGDLQIRKEAIKNITQFTTQKSNEGWRIHYFVVCPNDLDLLYEHKIMDNVKNLTVHKIYEDPEKYLKKVRTMQVFIGMRLHSVILSMCAGVPSIMIEYSPKCRDFMMSIKEESSCLSLEEITHENLQQRLIFILSHGAELSSTVTSRMLQYKEKQEIVARKIIEEYFNKP